jgi:hypothetical protein
MFRTGTQGGAAKAGSAARRYAASSDDDSDTDANNTHQSQQSSVHLADPSRRVKKHGKHRMPFKPKTAGGASSVPAGLDGGSSVLTEDSGSVGGGSTTTLQRQVRRVLRKHIGPGRLALDETAEEKVFIEAMGNDAPTNSLMLPAKQMHGDIPGLKVLQPEMFGDGLVMPGLPEATASPTSKSVRVKADKSAPRLPPSPDESAAQGPRPMSTGDAARASRGRSPVDFAQSRVLSVGSVSGLGGSVTGSPTNFAATSSSERETGSPHKISGGFVGLGIITEKGRAVEYSTLRVHKQRVIRSITGLQQASPAEPIVPRADQDTESVLALEEKMRARDAKIRAQDARRIVSQKGAAYIPPINPPSPIRPTPSPKVVSQPPAKDAEHVLEEPPKFPLYY